MSTYPITPLGSTRTQGVSSANQRPRSLNTSYSFKERFMFNEQSLEQQVSENDLTSEQLSDLLARLMSQVLARGCDIAARPALSDGKSTIAASFLPPLDKRRAPIIYLPLPVEQLVLSAAEFNGLGAVGLKNHNQQLINLCQECNNKTRLKIIILLAHEYGHFLSFTRGYHDQQLKIGLQLLAQRDFDRQNAYYAYQVFREEITAWRLAVQTLERYNFAHWEIFEQVKYSSCQAYYQIMKLAEANLAIYSQLSMLGIDLQRLQNE